MMYIYIISILVIIVCVLISMAHYRRKYETDLDKLKSNHDEKLNKLKSHHKNEIQDLKKVIVDLNAIQDPTLVGKFEYAVNGLSQAYTLDDPNNPITGIHTIHFKDNSSNQYTGVSVNFDDYNKFIEFQLLPVTLLTQNNSGQLILDPSKLQNQEIFMVL